MRDVKHVKKYAGKCSRITVVLDDCYLGRERQSVDSPYTLPTIMPWEVGADNSSLSEESALVTDCQYF